MTQQCLEILNRGGYCSEKDMDILLSELPYLRRTDYGFDNGMHGYRHYIRFYLHNVRGYCYIYDTYNLYEGILGFPGYDDIIEFLENEDKKEAHKLRFFNLNENKEFSSYKELEEDFISAGGHSSTDLTTNPCITKILSKSCVQDEDILKLHDYINYLVWSEEMDEYYAVIWLNYHQYCVIPSGYRWDELDRCQMYLETIYGITLCDHGVCKQFIPYGTPIEQPDDKSHDGQPNDNDWLFDDPFSW